MWTDEARAAEFMARNLVPISVSIGHEPVIVQPAFTIACSCASQPDVDLWAKTMTAIPSGAKYRHPSAIAFCICCSNHFPSLWGYLTESHPAISHISLSLAVVTVVNKLG
jgi:hypothetical protein